jgi:hypothetical protein
MSLVFSGQIGRCPCSELTEMAQAMAVYVDPELQLIFCSGPYQAPIFPPKARVKNYSFRHTSGNAVSKPEFRHSCLAILPKLH